MEMVKLTPGSPYCVQFEKDALLCFAWNLDLSHCNFNGLVVDGVLVARIAWEENPGWGKYENAVGIVSLETHYKYRCKGYGQFMVDYIRRKFSTRPVVLEINSPFAFQFWRRYNPINLGRGRGHASVFMLPPYDQDVRAAGSTVTG